MEPIEFMGMDETPLKAPKGTEKNVVDLPVKSIKQKIEVQRPDGSTEVVDMPIKVSCWYFTDEDIEKLITEKVLWFGAWGESHPPIFLTTERPF